MAEQEELNAAEQEELKAIAVRQKEIQESINPYVIEIKNLSDSLITIMGKETLLEADLDSAFELNDAIQEQSQEITALLFDLRDTIKP
jgi:hypothetical protein